jgi:hypothetical protein
MLEEFRKLQLAQKAKVRSDRLHGINGVLPLLCQHTSLCQTVKEIQTVPEYCNLQIIQIGHWTACPFVYDFELLVGTPGDILVVTVLDGSITDLIEWAPRDSHVKQKSVVDYKQQFIWHIIETFKDRLFQAGCPPTAKQVGTHVYLWPSQDFILRQKAFTQKSCIAWHLLVKERIVPKKSLPSVYFAYKDRDYWALNYNDTHCPSNKAEAKLGLSYDLCDTCISALDTGIPIPQKGQTIAHVQPPPVQEQLVHEQLVQKQAPRTIKKKRTHSVCSDDTVALDVTLKEYPDCLSLDEFFTS